MPLSNAWHLSKQCPLEEELPSLRVLMVTRCDLVSWPGAGCQSDLHSFLKARTWGRMDGYYSETSSRPPSGWNTDLVIGVKYVHFKKNNTDQRPPESSL